MLILIPIEVLNFMRLMGTSIKQPERSAKTDSAENMKKVDEEMRTWTAVFRIEVQDEFNRRGGQTTLGPAGSGDREPRSKHDKKDLAVWRLADNVTKLDFRHRVEAVEVNLEGIHVWSKPDLIFDLVRRKDVE